ncbi:MAG TPA: hypothetical protein VN154_06885 [Rhizomicrobium sp.]|nr:hypothetical protein [Rhizomicrobium sp.]
MRKLFATIVLLSALGASEARAACTQPGEQLSADRNSLSRAVLVTAMSCGDVAVSSRAVFYRTNEPQQADAAFLAFVLLLKAQSAEEHRAKAQQ